MDECLEGLEAGVNSDMNGRLLATFTVSEVEMALGQMHPFKSLGRFCCGLLPKFLVHSGERGMWSST